MRSITTICFSWRQKFKCILRFWCRISRNNCWSSWCVPLSPHFRTFSGSLILPNLASWANCWKRSWSIGRSIHGYLVQSFLIAPRFCNFSKLEALLGGKEQAPIEDDWSWWWCFLSSKAYWSWRLDAVEYGICGFRAPNTRSDDGFQSVVVTLDFEKYYVNKLCKTTSSRKPRLGKINGKITGNEKGKFITKERRHTGHWQNETFTCLAGHVCLTGLWDRLAYQICVPGQFLPLLCCSFLALYTWNTDKPVTVPVPVKAFESVKRLRILEKRLRVLQAWVLCRRHLDWGSPLGQVSDPEGQSHVPPQGGTPSRYIETQDFKALKLYPTGGPASARNWITEGNDHLFCKGKEDTIFRDHWTPRTRP